MFDELLRLNEQQLAFLAGITALLVTATTILGSFLIVQGRKLRERQLDLGFKSDMLGRGLSVDETVRLASARRPTWTQSFMALGDWATLKLSHGCQSLVAAVPHVARPCRCLLRSAWENGAILANALWIRGGHRANVAWRRGRELIHDVWTEARPFLRWLMKSTSKCIHWLGDQTDRMIRRLAPHRP